MNKQIYKIEDIKNKIIHAIDTISEPIASTLSPRGSNVLYEDDQGNQHITKDGFTIASNIRVADPIENAIIEIIKEGSKKTNLEAGDGTSSTVVVSGVLVKEGLRLIDNGHNRMDIRDELNKFSVDIIKELKKGVMLIKGKDDIKKIALISSSNDETIANDIVRIIDVVGEDGQVIIDRGFTPETEIIEDTGFVIKSGIFIEELANKQLQASMMETPILITDKRLYYKAEAEKILSTILTAGYNEVVIVAQDFIGDALPYFVANHTAGKIKVILVIEKKREILEDLAIYLSTEVVSDKRGSLVDNIKIEDFAMTKRTFSDKYKTIISRDKKEVNKEISKRVNVLKSEMKKIGNKVDPEYKALEKRVSSLTVGMVTIKVGGAIFQEIIEKTDRYTDAILAVRVALKEGYLPGGGISVYNALKRLKINKDYERIFRQACEVNVRQIAENCGQNPSSILEKIDNSPVGYGYNAVSGKIEDMLKVGVIEPFIVVKQIIINAISIANLILTSRWLVLNDLEDYKLNNKENK